MVDKEYTPEELKSMSTLEALFRLKDMKEGDKITWQHIAGVRFFFGDLMDKVPEPQLLGSVYFKNGTVMKTGIMADAEITVTEEK